MISDNPIEAFSEYLVVERDASKSTVKNYTTDLRLFIQWFNNQGDEAFSAANVTPYDIKAYKEHVQDIGRAPATINRYIISLKMFFAFCEDIGLIDKSPARKIKQVPYVPTPPRALTEREETRLVRAAEKYGDGLTDYTILLLMLHTGLRVSEVCKLKWGDVTTKERSGELLIRASKRGKYRSVPLNLTARNALRDYRDCLKTANSASDYVFPGRDPAQPMTPRNIGYMVANYARLAEVEDVSPHDLRHRFGYKMSKVVELHVLADIMGHDDINTTRRYTTPTKEDLGRAVEALD